jgi:hypothetical protein
MVTWWRDPSSGGEQVDETRHRAGDTCLCCDRCVLVNFCGVPHDDPVWQWDDLHGAMNDTLAHLTGQDALLGCAGPWCGTYPWFAVTGHALNFSQGRIR